MLFVKFQKERKIIYKLEIKNLSKIFGDNPKQAIKLLQNGETKDEIYKRTKQTVGVYNSSFGVKEGETFVVMGLSGSGKSTLIRMLNRLIEPTLGQIYINGENITKINQKELRKVRRKEISMVFQSFALMPHMTILKNVSFGLELGGASKKECLESSMKALEQVGLSLHANAYPDELSGGMQQRVGLARALANNPEILLMDEAFSALDPLIRSEMQDELLKLQEEQKRTIIFISHDLDEAMKLGDRIAIMQGGHIVQIGSPEEILRSPANEYVRSFFERVNVGGIFTAKDIASNQHIKVIQRDGSATAAALKRLQEYDREYGYVVNASGKYQGVVCVDSLTMAHQNSGKLVEAYLEGVETLRYDAYINEVIAKVAQAPCGLAVVDEKMNYLGVVTKATLLKALDFNGGKNE